MWYVVDDDGSLGTRDDNQMEGIRRDATTMNALIGTVEVLLDIPDRIYVRQVRLNLWGMPNGKTQVFIHESLVGK